MREYKGKCPVCRGSCASETTRTPVHTPNLEAVCPGSRRPMVDVVAPERADQRVVRFG